MSPYRTARTVLAVAATAAALVTVGPSSARAEPVTLDGVAVVGISAVPASGPCAASVNSDGVTECFSTRRAMVKAQLAALQASQVPPGYGAIPPAADRGRIEDEMSDAAAPGASDRRRSRPAQRGRFQKDGYNCGTDTLNLYRNPSFVDSNPGMSGYSGSSPWRNYSSSYNNDIESFWNMSSTYIARWHDDFDGGGAYYAGGTACRYVDNLANVAFGTGNAANRFSSWLFFK